MIVSISKCINIPQHACLPSLKFPLATAYHTQAESATVDNKVISGLVSLTTIFTCQGRGFEDLIDFCSILL